MADPVPLNSQSPAEPQPSPPKGALLAIFVIVCVDLLGFGLIIPLLPFYARKHDATPLQVTLLFSIYSFCQFIGSPVLGLISDRLGRRPVLIFSQLGGAMGYLLLGWATARHWDVAITGLWVIYLSRVIAGLCGGSISTAQAYISDITTTANRAKGMGVLGAAFGIGLAIGPALGGMLGHINAAWPAWAAVGLSVSAAILSVILLPETRIHKPAAAEIWLHPRQFAPILRRPVLLQLMLIWFTTMAAFVMMDSAIAMFLADTGFHYGPRDVGWYFLFVGVIIIIVQGGLIGRLTRHYGEWSLSIAGPALVGVGAMITALAAYWPLVGMLAMAGAWGALGRSLQQPTISSLVSKLSDPREQGATFGLFQGLGSLARVFGPIVGGLLYGHAGSIRPTWPYWAGAAMLGASALWMLAVKASADAKPAGKVEPIPEGP